MDDSERRKQLAGIRDAIQRGAFQPMGINEAKRMLEKHLRGEKTKNDMVSFTRAEYEVMRKDFDALRSRVAELERECEARHQDHEAACCIIADMHRAAVGQITGPRRGVVEDVEDIHRMAECAAIVAVCGYFSRMRGPDAWQLHIEDRRFLWTKDPTSALPNAIPLYAGSAPAPAAQTDILASATEYAHNIVTWLHRDHYADNTTFEPFSDLLGLLSQIDNMICGWKKPQPSVDVVWDAAVGAAIERAARDLPEWCAVEVHVENGSATVYAYDEACDVVEIETSGEDTLAAEINAAVEALLAAKAKVADDVVMNLVAALDGLVTIVERVGCGDWRDEHGRRLKDTDQWVAAYLAAMLAAKAKGE